MSAVILPLFNKLWHHSPDVRIAAATDLIAHLEQAQSAYKTSADASNEASTSATTLDGEHGIAGDVAYTLKRLIRGLASPRESSRLGFAVTLTEVLARIADIRVSAPLSQILATSEVHPATHKGAEERDLLFARLFGMHCLVTSGILFKISPNDEKQNTIALRDFQTVVEETLVLGERKPWLRESSGWIIREGYKGLTQSAVPWRSAGIQVIINALFSPDKSAQMSIGKKPSTAEWTPERLALAIMLQRDGHSPANGWASKISLQPVLPKPAQILSNANLSVITRILRGVSAVENGKRPAQAEVAFLGNGQLHFVWEEILAVYFGKTEDAPEPSPKKQKSSSVEQPLSFDAFYAAAVDEAFLGVSTSASAKAVGLNVSRAFVQRSTQDHLPQILSSNLLRTLVNHLVKRDRALSSLCRQMTAALIATAQARPAMALPILMRFVRQSDELRRFDAISGTKTIEGLVAALDASGISQYTIWLISHIMSYVPLKTAEDGQSDDAEGSQQTRGLENSRAWAIDQLLLLVRRHAQPAPAAAISPDAASQAWVSQSLQLFATHGFFTVLKTSKKSSNAALRSRPTFAFSPATMTVFRSRLYSALAHLVTISPKCAGASYVQPVSSTLQELAKDDKHVTPISVETLSSMDRAIAISKSLESHGDQDRVLPPSLLLHVVLVQANDADLISDGDLEELCDACDALLPGTITAPAPVAESDDDEEGEAASPASVLIDLMLSLLSRPSALLRIACERTFAALCGAVDDQGMQMLLEQITPPEAQADGLAADEADEEMQDAAEEDGAEEEIASENDDDDSSVDSDADSDDLGIDLDADPELRDKVAAALKSMGMAASDDNSDADGSDKDGSESEDEVLDDEQMLELDEQLAEIFRARKAESASRKAEANNDISAQLKVLDLLNIYSKQQAENSSMITVVAALLQTARPSGSTQSDVSSKAARTLRSIVTKPKGYPQVNDTAAALMALQLIHDVARKNNSTEIGQLAAQSAAFVTRAVAGSTGTNVPELLSPGWLAALRDFTTNKKSKLHQSYFSPLIQRNKVVAWELRDLMTDVCAGRLQAADQYRRFAVLTLLEELLSSQASQNAHEARAQVMAFMPKLADVATILVRGAAEATPPHSIARVREVLAFAGSLQRTAKKLASNDSGASLSTEVDKGLQQALKALAETDVIKQNKAIQAQLQNILQSGSKAAKSTKAHAEQAGRAAAAKVGFVQANGVNGASSTSKKRSRR